jgi:hypothetical protein
MLMKLTVGGNFIDILRAGVCTKLLQSNLCITTTLGTPKLRPLLTCGRCSKVIYVVKV